MRQEVQATIRDQLKDREYLELSIAKSIEERMELWGKRLTYFLGIPVALVIVGFSLFGIRSIKDAARDLTADVKKNAEDAVSEAKQVKNEAKSTEGQFNNLQKEVSILRGSTSEARADIEKNRALFNQAAQDLQPEVDRVKKLAQQYEAKSRQLDTVQTQLNSVQDAVASATSLSQCPPWGSAEKDSPQGLLNQVKRSVPSESTPKMLSFEDFRSLQTEADSEVGQGLQLDLNARQKLRNLRYSGGTVSEGDLVQLTGYVLVARIEAAESVNCELRGPINNDIHIALVNKPKDTEFDAVVAEAIPQMRPPSWNAPAINQEGSQERHVLIVGQLLYDNPHRINSDPNNPLPQPRRFSLWEIHPITRFLICLKTAQCDVTHEEQWTPLVENAQ